MAQPNPLFELGQQSMLRIIRSARSRLSREHSADDERAKRGGARQSAGGQQLDRPVKRASTARSTLGGVSHHRLTRSRSSLEQACGQGLGSSENAAPEKLQPPPAQGGGAVLGDVTNLAAGPLGAGASPTGAGASHIAAKPGHLIREPGPAQPLPPSGHLSEHVEADARHADDPQHVMEYMADIYRVLHREEVFGAATPGYMDRQAQVNAKMRGILVDWLVSVQQKYKLKAETLFLAVSLIDRYLELKTVARRFLQLVGVTALLIAAKFEELYPPVINDFVYVTDKAYTKDDIIKMEVAMLTALDFKICRPTPVQFLDRYQVVNGCTEAHRDLAQYLLELTLTDYSMIKYAPSRLAASAVLLSNKLLRRQPSWKPAAVKHTRFTEQMLKDCAKEMCGLLEHAEHSSLQAVRKKFSQLKHHSVAKLTFTGPAAPAAPLGPADEPRPHRRSTGGRAGAWEPPLAPRLSMGSPRAQPPAPSTMSAAPAVSTALFEKAGGHLGTEGAPL